MITPHTIIRTNRRSLSLTISKEGKLIVRAPKRLSMDYIYSFIKIIMYYAPIGLGVYFAVLIGTFGASIALGYAKTFIVYTLVSIVFFFVAYSIYAYIAGGKNGVKKFYKNIP